MLMQEPTVSFKGHDAIVEDVAWNNFDPYVFNTVGDDKLIKTWDVRDPGVPKNVIEGHTSEVMSIDCSPFNQYLMITGSADSTVAVWDTRNPKSKLFSLRSHTAEVNNVKFSQM